MVKTTTKISMHELRLIHGGNERDLCSRRRRWSKYGRASRSSNNIHHSRLHTRPLGNQMCIISLNRFLTYGTHGEKERGMRNGDVQVCEDVCDNWRKDELITCSSVSIDFYNRFYHMWRKIYRKILHKREKKTSTRLSDSVIVWSWCENKGHHHIKDPWTFSKLSCGKI